MDPKRPLLIATVLFAAFAALWLLIDFVAALSALLVVGLLVPLAGFVTILWWQRHLQETDRIVSYIGSIGTLAWFGLVLVFSVLANPIATKGEPEDRLGINEDPAAFWTEGARITTTLLPLMVVVGTVLALWPAWGLRERALGVVGAALQALVTIPPLWEADLGSEARYVFVVGIVAWLAALLLPLVHPAGADSEWTVAHSTE